MNVEHIFHVCNQHQVAYLLIGGMNFMLRHEPVLTFDVDLWIDDTDENRMRCEQALAALDAEWGQTDADWEPVARKAPGWLALQGVYSLHSPHGAIDIFRAVQGLDDWSASRKSAIHETTTGGVVYYGISDDDMLRCQLALDPPLQKISRIQSLQAKLKL
ncbi:MAG: hypothetical protein L0211_03590 [Planctomycetaceae bacterium]|nr:hypothetical protein [Planctomycetaceae bacterium]